MFEDKNYNSIKNRMLTNIDLPLMKNEGSILDSWASGSALVHADFYVVLEKLLNIAFIEDSFGENLDKRVAEFGITRKSGRKAAGFITVSGENGTKIKYMDTFTYAGKNYFVVENVQDAVIEDGVASIFVEAEETGEGYNVDESTQFTCNIDGVNGDTRFATVVKGTNDETDEELKERFYFLQRHRGTSGNEDDYINWALEVEGVKNVKVVPLWAGNGTVKVIIMSNNNRNVDDEVVRHAQEYIDSKKPIGAKVTVVTPTVFDVNISATIEKSKTVDLEEIKSAMRRVTDLYLVDAVEEITYTKIAGLLSRIEGVIDFKDFKINEGTKNVKLQKEQVGSVGNIVFREGVVD